MGLFGVVSGLWGRFHGASIGAHANDGAVLGGASGDGGVALGTLGWGSGTMNLFIKRDSMVNYLLW
jgi:hypothetical protein